MKASWKVLIALLTVLFLVGCSQGSTTKPTAVKVSSLMDTSVPRTDVFSGMVVAQQTKEFKKDETKVIKEIFVKEGDTVAADTVLFSYDTDAMNIEVQKAQLEIERMNNSIISSNDQIEALKAERANQPPSAQLSYTLQIQTLQAEIAETQYNIKAKNVELQRLKDAVGQANVVAGFEGIVQNINQGDQYDPYTGMPLPFMTILQTGNYRIKGLINELSVNQIFVGTAVTIVSRIDGTQTWSGMVDVIELDNPEQQQGNMWGAPDDGMGTSSNYPFYVTLENTDGLFLGQHVYIVLGEASGPDKEGVWLPSYYVNYSEEGATQVWLARNKKATLVEVVVGEYDMTSDTIQIIEGLSLDDYVIDPMQEITEGASVSLVEGD